MCSDRQARVNSDPTAAVYWTHQIVNILARLHGCTMWTDVKVHKQAMCDSSQLRNNNNIIDSSNTDSSLTMAHSNSFLSPYEILPTAQENKYLGKFSHFIMKLYVVCTH